MRQQQPTKIMEFANLPFPETYDIERQVLADVVGSPDVMGEVCHLVHESFFTSDDRKAMWATIVERFNKGQAIDPVTMGQMLGQEFIIQVMATKQGAGLLESIAHVSLLRVGAARRRAYLAAATFLQKALDPTAGEQEIIAQVETLAAQVEGPAPVLSEVTLAQAVEEVRAEVKATAQAAAEGRSVRIATGFPRLDGAINNGFKPGQLVVLAARPGVGKTSLMLHLAKHAARGGFPVYISTLEMTEEELGEKFIYSTGRVRPAHVAHGTVDWAEFDAAAAELSGLPIYINQHSRTLDEIVGRITQAVKRGDCRIAFIDYLGLFQDTDALGGGVKLYQVIARITKTLKAMAKRLGIPVVLLCQLNREAVRDDKHPELYHLRDSGSIEQDADIVLMLENEYRENKLRVIAWLRKNRSGRRVNQGGGDFGFILEPNDTYSEFTEAGIHGEIQGKPAPRPVRETSYNPDAFHSTEREETYDQTDLPF